jgi:hypothetical protein
MAQMQCCLAIQTNRGTVRRRIVAEDSLQIRLVAVGMLNSSERIAERDILAIGTGRTDKIRSS